MDTGRMARGVQLDGYPHREARRALIAAWALAVWVLSGAGHAAEPGGSDALWQAVRDGTAFAIMRHALAPGTDDPADFKLGDCATQRNLSERGRWQAAQIGDRFRARGIRRAAVFSSAWCRCQDTAELLNLGPVETLPPLNSFFRDPENREPQTAALEAWLGSRRATEPLILVTHQVNITALTGRYTGSGEILVVRRDPDNAFAVLGALATPAP